MTDSPLEQFRKDRLLTFQALADLIGHGVQKQSVHTYCTGKSRPDPARSHVIWMRTGVELLPRKIGQRGPDRVQRKKPYAKRKGAEDANQA